MQWVAVPWPATHTLQNSTQPPPVLVALKRTLTAWSKCPAKWKITESVASSNVSRASPPRMRLLPELGFSASSALTCSLSHSGYRAQGYLRVLLLLCCLETLPTKYRFPSQPVGGDDNNNKGATHGGQRMSSGSGGGGGRDLIPVWCGSTSRMVCGVVWCGSVVQCGSVVVRAGGGR